MKTNTASFRVVSNFFYIVPLLYAVQTGIWLTAILAGAVMVCGIAYHLTGEKRFFWPDAISAYLLIATNLFLCYLGHFQAPYFWIALLFVFLAFFYHFDLQNRGQYNLNHGMWHLYGALITQFCLFTLVL